MITPSDLKVKAERRYLAWLSEWLRGEPFVPWLVPVGTLPKDYRELATAVQILQDHGKTLQRPGYRIEWHTRQMRSYGTQSLPKQLVIDTELDLLSICGKRQEFQHFQADVTLIRSTLPDLEVWLQRYPQRVIEFHQVWPDLLQVCLYFLNHPRPGCYIRELPLRVHTKFIEQYVGILAALLDAILPSTAIKADEKQFERRYGLRYDEPVLRLRFLDPQVQAQCGLPLSDVSAPLSQIATLPFSRPRCLIVENKLTFLTLPPIRHGLAVFGGGFAVQNLRELAWLSNASIWYWGDLDAQGFQILSQVRSMFPQVQSLLMDEETLQTFRHFVVVGRPCAVQTLLHLTTAEQALFHSLATHQQRLEQERIGHDYVVQQLLLAVSR
jgi:hypothetical protein